MFTNLWILVRRTLLRYVRLNVVTKPPVVCLSVCLSSVTLVHPTQRVELFGKISAPSHSLGTRYKSKFWKGF